MVRGDRRSPYVILGIPYGASDADARAGFARAARRLRRADNAQYTTEDLTWALHQIEQVLTDPGLAMHMYRLPADPEALESHQSGCFNPVPHRFDRRSPTTTTQDLARLRVDAIAQRLRSLIRSELRSTNLTIPYRITED